MDRSRTIAFRTGYALLILAAVAYLAAIWTTETTSGRLGLTGLVLMLSGFTACIIGAIMPANPAKR
jgi:CHASE2 domain-containing sensor protein